MTAVHLPKPMNWQDFESAMRVLVACDIADPTTQMHGRQGQKQDGVDIYGRRAGGGWVGVQCKLRLDRPITVDELRAELEKARGFEPPLAEYVLATTAKRNKAIQREARRLTEASQSGPHPIAVSVWSWDDIEQMAAVHAAARKAFDPDSATQAASPSPHDRDLLGRFRGMAPQATRDFLWQHSFRGGTLQALLEPFDQMAETFQGLDNEFDDAEVQAAFAPVMMALARFVKLAESCLNSDDRHPHVLTPQTDDDRRNRVRTQATRDRVAQIEASARRLFELMETFLRLARERIGS
jgi:hypothetical protein